MSFTDPSGLLLKGPVSTCAPGDTSGIVCGGGSGGIDGSGGGAAGAGGGDGGIADPGGGMGGFCDASGDCSSGIGSFCDASGNCSGVGGVLPPITLDGTSLGMPGSIQFGAAAIASQYTAYLTGLATTINEYTFYDQNGLPFAQIDLKSTDTPYLTFLQNFAPTLSPFTPMPPANPLPQKPPNPCSFFPNRSCFHLPSPNPPLLQPLTTGNTATPFWDFLGAMAEQ